MPLEIAINQTMRMRPSYCELAVKLAKYHNVRGRGKLFELYLKQDMEAIKAERSKDKVTLETK